ncbi:MAG: hypothetical protein RI897_2451 [Verrucomicrobiota bacterium]|jgi:signal transduction histidine kinase/HAMP domain-containing protein
MINAVPPNGSNTRPVNHTPASRTRPLLCTLLAGAGGYYLNGFGLEVFTGVHFIWGGLLYFIVALAHGPGWGFLAATLASARTLLLWGHPYAWISLSLEGLVLGWLVQKRRGAFAADLLYWAAIGMPMVAIFYFLILKLPNLTSWTILVKQPLNSLLAVAGADLLLRFKPVRQIACPHLTDSQTPPLRVTLTRGYSLATALPILSFVVFYGRILSTHLYDESLEHVEHDAAFVAQKIEDHLLHHRRAIEALATTLTTTEDNSNSNHNRWLQHWHSTYPDFLTMLTADIDGNLHGMSLQQTQPTTPVQPDVNISDRDYLQTPLQTGKAFISDVFLGRGFGSDPIVAISAPVRLPDGSLWGIVEGSLRLSMFSDLGNDTRIAEQGLLLILDQQDRVIYSSAQRTFTPLQDLSQDGLVQQARQLPENRSFHYTGTNPTSPLASGYLASYTQAFTAGMAKPWHALIRINEGQVNLATQRYAALILTGLLVTLILASLFAEHAALRVTTPIESLVKSVRNLDLEDHTRPSLILKTPRTAEVALLATNLESMAARLQESYNLLERAAEERASLNHQLQNLVQDLDQRVANRTAALQESEARLNQAQALAQIGSWHLELPTKKLSASAETIRMYRLPNQPTVSQNDLLPAIHPEDQPLVRQAWHDIASTGETYNIEYRILAKTGIDWVREQAHPETDDKNEITGVVGTVQNITKRRQLEEQTLESLREAQHLSRLKSEFVTLVSHEFRTPLAAILNASELLEDSYDRLSQEKRDNFFQMIRNEVHRLSTMLQETLALGRIDSGQMQCHPKPIDIRQLYRRVIQQAHLAHKNRAVVDVSENLATTSISADDQLLFLILLNLLTNAYKYSEPDTPVTLLVETTPSNLHLEVHDKGIGIPQEAQDRLFDAFYRAPNVNHIKGTGVGLYVTQRAVELCGGKIHVVSNPDQGTTFLVDLPLQPLPDQTQTDDPPLA